ncbi:MAG TPA: cytochrome P450 [Mycobacteriales bacterium]|jgi:cytochrome P450|nr:cytochrome P450 [Mycobacteriales bacterium]
MTQAAVGSAEPGALSFQPFDPGFTVDPYPHYAALRTAVPVEQHEYGFWALWRYRDVDDLLRSKMSVEDRYVTEHGPLRDVYDEIYSEADHGRRGGGLSMLDRDPPDHTRLRRLVAKAFTPKTVEGLGPVIDTLVEDALDRIEDLGSVNLIDELAFPLPFAVISAMLGMPEDDVTRLRELSATIVRSLEPVPDPEIVRSIVAAEIEMADRTAAAIEWKREHPGDDLLTALIDVHDGEDVLTDEELISQVILLYVAGHETTVNLIGNGAYALLRDPEQADLLRREVGIEDNAVEELLRFDSPVQLTRRVTVEDYTVDGHVVPRGRFVIASLGSSNRDEAVFGPDANRVRLDRPNARQHMSFGGGVHHCLGNALARREGRAAIAGVFRRFPALTLDGEVTHNGRINLRGVTQLPVSVR